MIAKYPLNESFFIAKPKQSNSWAWKCILKNRDQFRKGLHRKVGDGTNINFWLDNWCDNENIVTMCGITDTSLLDMSLKISDMITSTNK